MVDKIQKYVQLVLNGYDSQIQAVKDEMAIDKQLVSEFKARGLTYLPDFDAHTSTLNRLNSQRQQFILLTTKNPLQALYLHADAILPYNVELKQYLKQQGVDNFNS